MKKVLLLLITITLLFSSACTSFNGCNKDVIDLTYKYNYAYINVSGEWLKYPIKSWTDYEGEQLQIVLEDGTVMLISSINCYLSTK